MAVLKIRDENGQVHEVVALRGEKGADGTVAFDALTDEQKASLKGDKGDKGDQGEQGIQGEKGDKGDSGYTPQKGIDYYTEADIAELIERLVVPVDQEFNIGSTNAIANRVVYEKLIEHEQKILGNTSNADAAHERINNFEEAYVIDITTLTNATDQLYNDLEEVKQHFGGIETALDEIITIQESLIGGEAV